ncbi:5801_t:CDS:1, partial [Paraglomus occultum]
TRLDETLGVVQAKATVHNMIKLLEEEYVEKVVNHLPKQITDKQPAKCKLDQNTANLPSLSKAPSRNKVKKQKLSDQQDCEMQGDSEDSKEFSDVERQYVSTQLEKFGYMIDQDLSPETGFKSL